MSDRVPAQTIGELDVHLSFMQRDLQRVVDSLALMATKEDLRILHSRIDKMATKSALMELEAKVDRVGVGSTFERVSGVIQKAATTAAAIGALVAIIVHLAERLK
jgi:precorrin-6B methylase 2